MLAQSIFLTEDEVLLG